MRSEVKWIAAGAAVLVAAGCAPVDRGFGEAYRYDMAIQTIDPDPVYPEGGAQPGDSGDHAQKATERYRKGTTKPVQAQSASSGIGLGGGPN